MGLINKTDPVNEMDFKLNSFNEQAIYTGTLAIAHRIKNLLFMKPGDLPSLPDAGINIQGYRFKALDDLVSGVLKEKLSDQITAYITPMPVENIDIAIVEERKRLRGKALNALNELGREIHYLLHFDAKRIYTKDLSSFYLTPAPEDYKDKMTTALSKAKCPNVYYYKMPSADLQKLESKGDTGNWLIGDVERLYVKRLVAMNLIEEFGFYHEKLVGDDAKYKVQPAVIDASKDHSLVNNTCWGKYVDSISGVPPLGKAESSISSIAKGALSDALGNLTFWDSTVEKFTWGQGKAGKILFVDDSKTYYLTKKGGDEADVAEASKEYLKAADCAGKEQTEITNFLTVIKNALKEVKNS